MLDTMKSASAQSESTAGQSKQWPGQASTYYGLPLIKGAEWAWQIVLYFFLGGLAGGAYFVAVLAHLLRLDHARELIRAGRYLSFVCILASPIFLIWDLGRPERFFRMLRILKLRSVMSIGSWSISVFGLFCGLSTAHQMANDGFLQGFPRLARLLRALPIKLIEVPGAMFGLLVASYTGVLLAATAVPIWARAKHILGPLFLTSGLSTALASLSCLLACGRRKQPMQEPLERAEMVTLTTELGLISALVPILGSLGKPLFNGRTGWLLKGGVIGGGLLCPLLTRLTYKLTQRSTPRAVTVGTSLLVLLGGLVLRYVWIEAGRTSANDPEATHVYNTLE